MNRKKLRTLFKIIVATAGVVLSVRLIRTVGWEQIRDAFQQHATALVLMTVVYLLYHLLRTWTLQICIPYPIRFRSLFPIRLAGEAVAYLAVGSIIGDAAKVALAREEIPPVEGATGVFAEKLIYHLSGAAFIMGGLFIGMLQFGASKLLVIPFGVMLLVFAGFLFLLSSGAKPVSFVLAGLLARKPALLNFLERTEESLFQFQKNHPAAFLATVALDCLSYLYSVGEVLFILSILDVPVSFWDIWYFEAIVKMSNSATMVVPANLGIFETTNLLLARQLGFADEAGMIVALFVRIRAIVWCLLGYLCFLLLLKRKAVGNGSAK